MVIKQVYIEQFGKLKQIEVKFSSGINIIYGRNESGKTTLEQFLLTMFYGHRTSKKYGVDPRGKYIPFDEDHIYGQMELQINQTHYIIQRKIGEKRKDDVFRSFEKKTLDQVAFDEHLGKQLFDLELDPFLKTLFVPQTGLKFHAEKDEILNTKLNNLLETGDEDISFTKAMLILDDEMKKIKSSRKTGSLDQLYDQLNDRFARLDQAKRNQEEQQVMEKKLCQGNEKLQWAKKNWLELENLKEKLHLYEVKDQVIEIYENLKHIEKLKHEREHHQETMSPKEIIFFKNQVEAMEREEEEQHLLEQEVSVLNRQEISLKLELENYVGYHDLSPNMTLQLVKNQGEQNLLQEKLKHFVDEKLLPPKLIEKRVELEKLLHRYEKHLKKLKPSTHGFLSLFLVLAGLISLSLLLWVKNWLASGILLAVLMFLLLGFKRFRRKKVSFHLYKAEDLERKIRNLANSLNMDPLDVISSKRLIDQLPKKHEKENLERELNNLQEESLRVFTLTNTKNLEEFMERKSQYDELYTKLKELRLLLHKKQEKYQEKKTRLDREKMKLKDSLSRYGYSEEKEDPDSFLETLNLKEQRNLNLMAQEESLLYTLKTLIGPRSLEDVENEVKTLEKLGMLKDNSLESVEEKQKDWIHEQEKWQGEIHTLIQQMAKYQDGEEPLQIEDEISVFLEEEARWKRRYLVLETTKDFMESSYKELRARYISALNDKVTDIFKKITKIDRAIKVADQFTMKYEEERKIFADYSLSKGTVDQLYFALRFAMIDLIFADESVPVFLDEPFVSYDEERLQHTLEYLHHLHQHQIFIFTCHAREVELLKAYGHVINMDKLSMER